MGTRLTWSATPAVKRRNWKKRSAFVLLAVLGAAFWIPPLLRATVGDVEVARSPDASVPNTPAASDVDLASAMRAATDPPRTTAAQAGKPAVLLTATILGKSRRAAVVNGRVRREGDRFAVADAWFRLVSVAKDRIELLRETARSEGERSLTVRMTPEHDGTK